MLVFFNTSETIYVLFSNSLEFYCRKFKIFKIQWSSIVGPQNNINIVGVLLSGCGFLLSGTGVLRSDILNNILKRSSCVFGVLLSLEFYCRIQRNF
jgi:hypothetical protein